MDFYRRSEGSLRARSVGHPVSATSFRFAQVRSGRGFQGPTWFQKVWRYTLVRGDTTGFVEENHVPRVHFSGSRWVSSQVQLRYVFLQHPGEVTPSSVDKRLQKAQNKVREHARPVR